MATPQNYLAVIKVVGIGGENPITGPVYLGRHAVERIVFLRGRRERKRMRSRFGFAANGLHDTGNVDTAKLEKVLGEVMDLSPRGIREHLFAHDDVLNNPQQFIIGPVGDPDFHPMKGPMTTQSLRGMDGQGPMHWRGDRTAGNDPGGGPHGSFFSPQACARSSTTSGTRRTRWRWAASAG